VSLKEACTINLKRVQKTADELQSIPGVGKSIAEDLRKLGIKQVNDLRNTNPEELYNELCKKMGKPIDRCMLYVFRCAVYFASNPKHDPEKLKWWNWKDEKVKGKGN
jgi:DNA polymerase/3'-5' exonuclease PolX